MTKPEDKTASPPRDERERRLAEALRANLRRRKVEKATAPPTEGREGE